MSQVLLRLQFLLSSLDQDRWLAQYDATSALIVALAGVNNVAQP